MMMMMVIMAVVMLVLEIKFSPVFAWQACCQFSAKRDPFFKSLKAIPEHKADQWKNTDSPADHVFLPQLHCSLNSKSSTPSEPGPHLQMLPPPAFATQGDPPSECKPWAICSLQNIKQGGPEVLAMVPGCTFFSEQPPEVTRPVWAHFPT